MRPIQTKKCPMCAEQIPEDSVLCPYCGTRFGEDGQVAPSFVKPVPPVILGPLPAPLPVKKSRAGLWIAGAVAGIILCGVIAALLWTQRANLPGLSGLLASPTLTATLTSTPSITPSITPSPTLAGTPLPDWVINFSEPILLAIQNRPPNFQDDFHDESGGWYITSNCADWRMQYIAGEMVMANCEAENQRLFLYTDFLLEVDARFVSYDSADGRWGVYWGYRGNNRISINNWGDISWFLNGSPISIYSGKAQPGSSSNHLLLIVKGTEFALYVNDQPLSYISNGSIQGEEIYLYVPTFQDTKWDTVVAFDNFKIWDISDLP